jgi:hypothetical protein
MCVCAHTTDDRAIESVSGMPAHPETFVAASRINGCTKKLSKANVDRTAIPTQQTTVLYPAEQRHRILRKRSIAGSGNGS